MKKRILGIVIVSLFLVGCTANEAIVEDMNVIIDEQGVEINEQTAKIDDLSEQITNLVVINEDLKEEVDEVRDMLKSNEYEATMMSTAFEIVDLLNDEDWVGLSNYVHPSQGVRLSPYQYVDNVNDQVFTASQISSIMTSSTVYNWGTFDGSGDPINLNFMDYYNRFLYDHDYYNAPTIGNNSVVSYGNMINNIVVTYPSASIVEFYFPQFDPQYSGMDWRSITLVLEYNGTNWKLVSIVHGEWTT